MTLREALDIALAAYDEDEGERERAEIDAEIAATAPDERCPRCGAIDDCPDPTCGELPDDPARWRPRKFS